MRHGLRALTIACTTTLFAAGALVGVAVPSGAQEVLATDCGSTTYRWLFWPDGHGALTSVPHPATDVPHVDVYSGKGKKFSDAQNVAYVDGTSATTGATCTSVPLPPGGSGSVKSTFGKAKQLVCTSKSSPIFVSVPESTVDFPSLSAFADDKLIASAQMADSADTASTLDYDGKVCKLTRAPK